MLQLKEALFRGGNISHGIMCTRETAAKQLAIEFLQFGPLVAVVTRDCTEVGRLLHRTEKGVARNRRKEITNAIDNGLLKLHLTGIFHQSEVSFGVNCITLLKGGLSI